MKIQTYKKSKNIPIDFDDHESPIFEEEDTHHENPTTNQEEEEAPSEPIQPMIIQTTRKRPNWLKLHYKMPKDMEAPMGTFRESRRPKRYSSYAAYMTKLIQVEPSTFEEAVQQEFWKKAMHEEYQSIMKNGVWEIIPRPSDKTIVTSKWIYKIKHF